MAKDKLANVSETSKHLIDKVNKSVDSASAEELVFLASALNTAKTHVIPERNEELFDKVGTSTWIVPEDVESFCAVLVGGGGGGAQSWAHYGGNGGALAYANNIKVEPGDKVTVVVGKGGQAYNQNGGSTYIQLNGQTLFTAEGGSANGTTPAKPKNGSISCQGGAGGIRTHSGSWQDGGGGAGGYSGQGGKGVYGGTAGAGQGGGGGGGAGYESSTYGFGGGGGVGLYGIGSNGTGGTTPGNSWYNSARTGGKGGSGGFPGAGNCNGTEQVTDGFGNSMTVYHGQGGKYGGGGAGAGSSQSNNSNFGHGGQGGARIIWGEGMSFPNNAQRVSVK